MWGNSSFALNRLNQLQTRCSSAHALELGRAGPYKEDDAEDDDDDDDIYDNSSNKS